MRNTINALNFPLSSLQRKDNFTQSTNEDLLQTEQKHFFFKAMENNENGSKTKANENLKWQDWNFTPFNTKSKLSVMLKERGKKEAPKNSNAKPYVSQFEINFLSKDRKSKDQMELFQRKRMTHQIKSEDALYLAKTTQYENIKNLIYYRSKLTKKRKDLQNQIKNSVQLTKLAFI